MESPCNPAATQPRRTRGPALLGPQATVAEAGAYPAWLKESFLDLPEDLADAREAGKTGIVLYFHTPTCSYCKALNRTTFADPGVVERLREAFDVIALDVMSDVQVVGLDGREH